MPVAKKIEHQSFQEIKSRLVVALRSKGSENRLYSYTDEITGRMFHIRRLGEDRPSYTYFLEELTPTGMVVRSDSANLAVIRDTRIADFEESQGPNKVIAACISAGIDPERMAFSGAGFSVNSIYHPSLIACAKEIEKCLGLDCRYSAYRELSEDEKAKLEHSSRVSSAAYWSQEAKAAESAGTHGVGVLKGCYNMFGPLQEAQRHAILAYLNAPNQNMWNEVRGLIITGVGTLWQAWSEFDETAPRSGSTGYPSTETLSAAIVEAVKNNKKKIAEKISESGSAFLRQCK